MEGETARLRPFLRGRQQLREFEDLHAPARLGQERRDDPVDVEIEALRRWRLQQPGDLVPGAGGAEMAPTVDEVLLVAAIFLARFTDADRTGKWPSSDLERR
jgi:hypothetical protein